MTPRVMIFALLAMALSACGAFTGDFTVEDGSTLDNGITVVNGRVEIGDDCRINGEVESVNGRIRVGSNSFVEGLQNVNGSIALAENVEVDGDVANVNGSLTIGADSRIAGSLETVNGRIETARGSTVGGKIASVNGGITLVGTQAAGLETFNSGIQLSGGTHIAGPLHVKRSRGLNIGSGSPPRVVIGPDARVDGPLTFEREVALFVHESATIGEVTGAEPVSFSGETP